MLYIAGAGGLGRETLDAALAVGREVTAFLDDKRAGEEIRGLPVLSPDEACPGHRYVTAIADPQARQRLAGLLDTRGLQATTVAHPRATIAPGTTMGPGCIVLAGAYISSDVTLGAHVLVYYTGTVGHDATLKAFSTVLPCGNVSGAVCLGVGATVGANAVVVQGLTVGTGAFVGAGAVVTRNVPDDAVVVGVPARPLHR